MPLRTPLVLIDGNRQFKEELTPNNRRKIKGTIVISTIYIFTAENVNCIPLIAQYTI